MDESILSPNVILYCHYRIIERTGGSHGVRDIDLLKAALVRPHKRLGEKELFPTPFTKAAVLMHALITTTPFNDGNRRTGVLAGLILLSEYGFECTVAPADLQEAVSGIVRGEVSFGELSDWLEVNSRSIGARQPGMED